MRVTRTDPLGWLEGAAARRREAGLRRRLRPRRLGEDVLDLAGNDYLGLTLHPEVTRGAAEAALAWGAGATGSRLVTGHTTLHGTLETELADFYGTEAALVFSSGFAANLGMVTALAGPGAHLVCDRYNHASLIDATRLAKAAGATVSLFAHADPESARERLTALAAPHRLLVSDTVFSVDGDRTDAAALAEVCREAGAALLLDDAHGLGVLGDGGRGALTDSGLAGDGDVVVSVTLSKALGSQGGAVLGSHRVIRHLTETARTFVFDTGLAPACAGGALAALRVLRREPERAARVRSAARRLADGLGRAGFEVSRPDAAVVSVTAPGPHEAVAWAGRCLDAGVRVGCFRPPSVPDGRSRLRLTARADLSEADVLRALTVLTAARPAG